MSSLQNVETQIATNMLTSGQKGSKKKKGGKKDQKSDLYRIVKLVMERGLNPVIVFSFSKKECEKYALDLNKEDYNDETEKDLVNQVYVNAIDSLSDDDTKLPQVEALLPLLKRGIGIHHGGLLPILKEIVEILFSEGLIKCLFATEVRATTMRSKATNDDNEKRSNEMWSSLILGCAVINVCYCSYSSHQETFISKPPLPSSARFARR